MAIPAFASARICFAGLAVLQRTKNVSKRAKAAKRRILFPVILRHAAAEEASERCVWPMGIHVPDTRGFRAHAPALPGSAQSARGQSRPMGGATAGGISGGPALPATHPAARTARIRFCMGS